MACLLSRHKCLRWCELQPVISLILNCIRAWRPQTSPNTTGLHFNLPNGSLIALNMLISSFERGSGIVLAVWWSQRGKTYWWFATHWDNANDWREMANTGVVSVAYFDMHASLHCLWQMIACFALGLSLWKIKAAPCVAAEVLLYANMQ